jgi:hypothetical protein
MSQWKEDNARDQNERSQLRGPSRRAPHLIKRVVPHKRLARDLVQRLARLHQIIVSGRGSAGGFDCFGNFTKALTFLPERAARVAERRISEHARLIHAFDAGQDRGLQQQSTLLDQLGHFREAQPGLAEHLRGAVLAGLGHGRIFRVHLVHGLFQACHVIDHRKTSSATVASMAQLVCCRRLAANRWARTLPTIAGLARTRPDPSVTAVSTPVIGNRPDMLQLQQRATVPENSKQWPAGAARGTLSVRLANCPNPRVSKQFQTSLGPRRPRANWTRRCFSVVLFFDCSVTIDPIEYVWIPFSFDCFEPNSHIINNNRMPGEPSFPFHSGVWSYSHFLVLSFGSWIKPDLPVLFRSVPPPQ